MYFFFPKKHMPILFQSSADSGVFTGAAPSKHEHQSEGAWEEGMEAETSCNPKKHNHHLYLQRHGT